jgi:hypothetical protein
LRDFIWFFLFWGALQRSNFYVNCRTSALNPKKCSMCLSLLVSWLVFSFNYLRNMIIYQKPENQ